MLRLSTTTRTPLAGTNKTSITCAFLRPAEERLRRHHTVTANTHGDAYRYSDSNVLRHTDSDSYAYGDSDFYATTNTYASNKTVAQRSSYSATEAQSLNPG